MTRTLLIAALTTACLLGRPATASADVTFFLGFSPTPESRPTRGFAGGISLLVMTPTSTQLYLTAGAGFFREALAGTSETSVGTNIGGGVKLDLIGPVQIPVDYLLFDLPGAPRHRAPPPAD